ncbi:hypothetical protein BC939DRAFT_471811 [Gamsiella multidivaricata]|uniref:uncharacterized protein n=1 Tax=Gamsiella multidivaricata TaxID=101098 RepID=UPI00221EAD44|nr:uncharacterized protein BC939DRAFT_471811 [Gamsiella multidivaricata]KAI7815762.1 hypothetical protein BC939DRAFT_471811 [Gamsiella multidivaricata]
MSHLRPIIDLREAKRLAALKRQQEEESTSTAKPVGVLSEEMVPFTQVPKEDWSPTFPSDVALGKRALAKPEYVPASQPDEEDDDDLPQGQCGTGEDYATQPLEEDDDSPQDQGGTDEDYEARLIAAQLKIEELCSALKRERDTIYKDEGTQVDRKTAEQGVQVEAEDDSRKEQRPRKRRRKARTNIIVLNFDKQTNYFS